MENKLKSDAELQCGYKSFTEEYKKLGHSPSKELNAKISYFLPHHAVRRKDSITTKLKVVLSWLSSPPRNWELFVAKRTSEILDIIPCKQWSYVPARKRIQPTLAPEVCRLKVYSTAVYVGEEIKGPPKTVDEYKFTLKGRWDIVQKLKLNFWSRWQIDCLNSMQGRTKWKSGTSNIKIGCIVIFKEDNLHSSVWPLGKVISTHPGLYSTAGADIVYSNMDVQKWDCAVQTSHLKQLEHLRNEL
ncbi:DUF5641 domain-containing protein [Trichonephila clavipes]|nr:DUF5641 domain-containing protein [Trichonephila clavipes]